MDATSTKNKSRPSRYDGIAQALHWSMAGILFYLIFFSQFEEVPDAVMEQRIQLHSGLGALIVILGVVRFYWRRRRPRPAPIANEPPWRQKASEIVHIAFYSLFLISPLFGIILAGLVAYPVQLFGVIEISGWLQDNETIAGTVNSLHGFAADVMTALLVLHVSAALYHQFVKRDGLIWRMLPGKG